MVEHGGDPAGEMPVADDPDDERCGIREPLTKPGPGPHATSRLAT